jgi:hypothetical protein
MGLGWLRRWSARIRRRTARPRLAIFAALALLAAVCPAVLVVSPPASAFAHRHV